MNKAAVKLVIVLVAASVIYSVFWFFKVGQVEKQINNFISENSANISAGQVMVSGFPFSQKLTINDLKFTIPNSVFGKNQTIVKHIEAKASVFSKEFTVKVIEQVSVRNPENDMVANVEFSKDPEIKISIVDGKVTKFSYADFGYRIVDADKNTIYAASSSVINLESAVGDGDKITTKITANIKDIEGFDVLDVYKNVLEKKIADGIKTGEIIVGANPTAEISPAIVPTAAAVATAAPTDVAPATTPDAANAAVPADAVKPAEDLTSAVANNNLIKSNLIMDVEYILTPIQSQQQAQIPSDPTQIQEMPAQYSKVVKVTNLEFSNPLYKISVNGEMNTFQDDNMPSGSVSFKVEKIDNLVNYLSAGLNQVLEQKKMTATSDVMQTSDTLAAPTMAAPSEDPYQVFLKRIVTNLNSVAKELAAKNAVSKEDVAAFDLRREKNLEFLVNETPLREILGKF
jgi:hypothetical protein